MTEYNFKDYKKHALQRPRDIAWGAKNWAKFEKVGDKVEGYIRDVFYQTASEVSKDPKRGLTLETPKGDMVNVSFKRLSFILAPTNNLRIGDPVVIELAELKPNKGKHDTKILAFYGSSLVKEGKTVKELEEEDAKAGGVEFVLEGEEEDADLKQAQKDFADGADPLK